MILPFPPVGMLRVEEVTSRSVRKAVNAAWFVVPLALLASLALFPYISPPGGFGVGILAQLAAGALFKVLTSIGFSDCGCFLSILKIRHI
jgi:hypothetical protein